MSPPQQPPADGPLLIVADTYQMARAYAREHGLGREGRGWRYVYEVGQVLGMRAGRYVTLTAGQTTGPALDSRAAVEVHLRHSGFTYGRDDSPRSRT